ncbi:TIGR03826 family flagellar region protein [Oceanobacillus chungangensis]|uniref:Flagellar protein n=1 Tax=Oceanobacillus chungangensis TaxID=1229152 RepID=A0A3D8PJ28_9BACI|nr:TIGR03826 family flagellar region protein [Oceanobacillus chungangensis]RDW15662.1 hypothetical protein CWR45_17980 [Oceanobacillus chungangensis]
MAELSNCPRCGNVFVKGIRDICQNCYKEEETAFQTVYKFLQIQKNRTATMAEIVEATHVDEVYISKFVKEKRLLPTLFPNLAYSCERCGTDIITGKLCHSCQNELKKDLAIHDEIETISEERRIKEKETTNTYYAFNKHKRN